MPDVAENPVALLEEFSRSLKPADYHRIARLLESQQQGDTAVVRAAFLSSYSASFLKPFLVVEAARRQMPAEMYFGAFGQFEQELLDPASALWQFKPDCLIIAMRPEDIDPEAVDRFHATNGERFAALTRDMLARLEQCALSARERMSGPILIANVALPHAVPLGLFDAFAPVSVTHEIAAFNRALAERVSRIPGAYVWDYAGLVHSRGAEQWTDPRMWVMARAAIAAANQPAFAAHLVRSVIATMRPPAKCLVLDLDNTLWGGVLGDDGPSGIQVGDDFPGSVFKQFQRAILTLADRGILLAIASKNNPDIVEETLRTHPEMVLRWDHFACVRANWRPKSENLREIARELNIGIDALVLFDDNPVERAEVRAAVPEAGVIDVPTDPLRYAAALRECGYFDQCVVQAEDRERVDMYRRQRERRELERASQSPEEFLHGLMMEAEVGTVDERTLGRVAQLINKTNQFNLTTRRHSEAHVSEMARDPDHVVGWLRLRDRFGDQGLVVVGILRRVDDACAEIDTFLMSCRVMNRHVEQAFMSYLIEHAARLGCRLVRGRYLPTAKNAMVKDFYPGLGFADAGALAEGGREFVLDLSAHQVPWPPAILRA